MYAVLFKYKNSNEWNFINRNIILSETDISQNKKWIPQNYLCNSIKEAKQVYLDIISKYKEHLKCIKISKMNKWNDYKTEAEVLPGYWREWDETS